MSVTPEQVETRLVELSKEIDSSQQWLADAEAKYYDAKAECEIALAEERLRLSKVGMKTTVQEREDIATSVCANLIRALAVSEATVKAARGNAARVRIQVDITRSIGTSVRSALDT